MRVFRGASLLSRLSVRTISSAVEREANRNPHNAEVQARLLELLVRDRDFQRVRVRVESGLFAVNAAGFDAYTKALAKLGLNDSVSAGVVSRVLEQVRASAPPPSPPPSSQHGFPPTPPGAPQGEPQLVKLAGPIEVKGVRQPVFLTLLRIMVPLALFLYVVNLVREGKLNMTGRREVHKAAKDEKTRLADVIGLEEAKREVKVLVEYLRAPQLFEKNGLEMPKGLLLFGPPGVGKTLLARAMAGDAGVPFFFASAASFEQMYVGLGATRIRSLFEDARANAPCIIFLDEIDSIGSKRTFERSPVYSQTLTQMLTLMDGFEKNTGVLVIGATNSSEEALDPALLRSGRFDKKVHLNLPFSEDRKRLYRYYLERLSKLAGPDTMKLAEQMAGLSWGLSGADISNVVNQAGILAVLRKSPQVTLDDLQRAHADVILGPENLSITATQEEKRLTAVHEAGHTIVASFAPGATPPRQVTVVSRKNALGYMSPDNTDRVQKTREEYLAEIAVAMGGRAAEELVYGADAVTSGAQSDFRQATKVAEAMVTALGFSEQGTMSIGARDKDSVSEATKSAVDSEIKGILAERYSYALSLLREKTSEHRRLTKELLMRETMSQEEIGACVGISSWQKGGKH